MIFKTASPLSPDVVINIDNVTVNYTSLQRISIEERENHHDLMTLDFSGFNQDLFNSYLEKAITVTISYPNLEPRVFYGYITFIEPVSVTKQGLVNDSPFQLIRIYCMGASYIMKSKTSNVWENITLPELAKEIADKYDFGLSVPKDSYRFSRVVQTAESDWAFLVRIANQLGYAVTAHGPYIHIWDSYKALRRNSSYSVLKTIKGLNGDTTPNLGQIIMFEAQYGAITPEATRAPDTVHVLDRDNNIMSISSSLITETSGLGTPLTSIFSNVVNDNADTYEMGNRVVSAALRDGFSVTAKVMITGLPILKPGSIVRIDKYESDFDGYWYVQDVQHQITKSELVSYLKIATDSTPVRQLSINSVRPQVITPPASVIRGRWVKGSPYHEVYE